MTVQRENWSARSGFILAAIGSAVGLGNIWRFPYVAYENGGGAFLLPYLVALLTAGLPLLFLDYAVGHKYRGSPPLAYRRLFGRFESLGWWQVMVTLFISIYYASVLSWAGSYFFFSVQQTWGQDTKTFFFKEYLKVGDAFSFGLVPQLGIGVALVWILTMIILYGGVKKGVEYANRICMPLLIILFVAIVIQALRLPGAIDGLNAFFTPNWSAMLNYQVWLAAYGHIFFSLSIGFGIMVTYASYLKPKSDLTGSGLVVGLANSSFEILAGIGVFAALGFMAYATQQPIKDVVGGGPGLAFIAFPKIISSLGDGVGNVFGMLFFGSLFVAGVTSMVSILEVPIAAFQDKFAWSRKRAVTLVAGGAAIISWLLFSGHSAIILVDIIDKFANEIGIVFGGLLSIILLTWFNRDRMPEIEQHINAVSSIRVGKLWWLLLTVVTPSVLAITLALSLHALLTKGYGDYSVWVQVVVGWGTVLSFVLGAWWLSTLTGHPRYYMDVPTNKKPSSPTKPSAHGENV